MSNKKRVYLSDYEATSLGLSLNQPQKGKKKARYLIGKDKLELLSTIKTTTSDYQSSEKTIMSAFDDNKKVMDIDEYCVYYNLPRKDITSYKLVSHTGIPYYNIVFKEKVADIDSICDLETYAIKSIAKYVKKKVKKSKGAYRKIDNNSLFDMAVFTDAHVGMDPNPNNLSLYGGVWNEKELINRKSILLNNIISNKKSDKLVIFDLGDFMDGWDAETVRRGHSLPQNMDNEKAFDIGLEFKISLLDELADNFDSIDVINICDDNHSGSFAYVVNSAFKLFIEHKHSSVKVINQRRFINHYIYENKVFVATHGKDGKNLKFGFKPKLDPVQVEKIENYLSEHDLISKDLEVFFIKGDSHQDIFDNSTSQKFKYWNFPAFSPSSNWVQTNFKKGTSGFYTFNFNKETYSKHPYYFKWKNKVDACNT